MIHLICYNLLRSDCNSTQISLIWYARTSSNPHISCQHWCQDTWMPRRTAGAHPWSNAPGELASNWPWRGCRGRSLAGLGPWADLRWIPWKNDKLGKYWANIRTSWTIWALMPENAGYFHSVFTSDIHSLIPNKIRTFDWQNAAKTLIFQLYILVKSLLIWFPTSQSHQIP
jgi:hypothetical protein